MGKFQSQVSIPQDIIDEEFDSISNGFTTEETFGIFALKYDPAIRPSLTGNMVSSGQQPQQS